LQSSANRMPQFCSNQVTNSLFQLLHRRQACAEHCIDYFVPLPDEPKQVLALATQWDKDSGGRPWIECADVENEKRVGFAFWNLRSLFLHRSFQNSSSSSPRYRFH